MKRYEPAVDGRYNMSMLYRSDGDWVRFKNANAEITRLEATVFNMCDEVEICHAEITRLRDALEEIKKRTYIPVRLTDRIVANPLHRIACEALGGVISE